MPESVSVIIPTWNRAHTIRTAVESVLTQTHAVYEVLVCDDGSSDGTEEIIRSFNDTRVQFITGKRAGRPAVPRNRGIAKAQGDWLAFLDSDDSWRADKLETQFAAIRKHAVYAAATNAARIVPGKGNVGDYLSIAHEKLSLQNLLPVNYVICSSALVKAELVKKAGGFPESEELRAIEDYALWLRIAAQTDFAYCREQLVNYTDDAAHSIRAGTKEFAQRENVMRDFYQWYGAQPQHAHLRDSRRALRNAMKRNGRSLIERWKI